jgi:hypothetical protein
LTTNITQLDTSVSELYTEIETLEQYIRCALQNTTYSVLGSVPTLTQISEQVDSVNEKWKIYLQKIQDVKLDSSYIGKSDEWKDKLSAYEDKLLSRFDVVFDVLATVKTTISVMEVGDIPNDKFSDLGDTLRKVVNKYMNQSSSYSRRIRDRLLNFRRHLIS